MQVISTSNLYSTTLGEALNVQSQWSTAETQQASGLKAQDFGTLGGGDSREMLNLETDIAQASNWSNVAQSVGTTTQAMYNAVGSMEQSVNKVQALISTATSSPNNSDLYNQANSILQTLMTEVNQQVGGSYLFAGSNTSVPPASLTNYPTLAAETDSSGNPVTDSNGNQVYGYSATSSDTSFYKGDDTVAAVQVNLQQTVSYGVLATNPAIEEAIRSVQSVLEAAQSSANSGTTAADMTNPTTVSGGTLTVNGTDYTITGGQSLDQIAASINAQAAGNGLVASVVPDTAGQYHIRLTNGASPMTIDDNAGLGLSSTSALSGSALTDSLQSSLTLANKAVTDLSNLQENISNTSNTLSTAQTTQSTFVTYLQNSLSSVKDVDTSQAAAQVQQYQTQLQASFLAVSTLNKLSLASML